MLAKLFSKVKKLADSPMTVAAKKASATNKQKLQYSGANSEETALLRELTRDNGSVQVDIPLNQDLAELQELMTLSGKEIDFDFSDLTETHTAHSRSEVLAFNPLKSFSQPVDTNLAALQQKGFITPDSTNIPLVNSFRIIKRPLVNTATGKGTLAVDNANLIMVTSSVSGEGKTFTAINLAISIAMERDKHVLLIDGDVNKPSHHTIFGFDATYGLTDLLRGKVKDMSRILYKTSIPSLTLMPAGRKTTHVTELFASSAMENFVREIASFYKDRIIIFDSSPLLLFPTETSVLATHMGQVVMVIEAENIKKQQVKSSLELLSKEAPFLLLNQAREKTNISYDYYQYENQA